MFILESPVILAREFMLYSGVSIPANYFWKGRARVFYDSDGVVVGGYAIIDKRPFRTLVQIPIYPRNRKLYSAAKNEITAYFIRNKKFGLNITYHLVKDVLKSKGPFVYSYDSSNKKLESYYKMGSPITVYSGQVMNLPGMSGLHYENVEILTKFGIIKLFIKRTIRGLKNDYLFKKKS